MKLTVTFLLISACVIIVSKHFAHSQFTRGALILTMGGQNIPKFLPWSCTSIEAARDSYDLLIFHESNEAIISMSCASNVIKIDVKKDGLARLISKAIATDDRFRRLFPVLRVVLRKIPYFLAQFKVASGTIFSSYLIGYSHWTYTDPDMVWGNLSAAITQDEMEENDVISLSKLKDADRLFLRGQFALHRNSGAINELWKNMSTFGSDSLIKTTRRVYSALKRNASVNAIKYLFFESAEGAYSTEIFEKNLNVAIFGRMFSDKSTVPFIWNEGYLSKCLCKIQECLVFQNGQFVLNTNCVMLDTSALPRPSYVLANITNSGCDMYWLDKPHQRCISAELVNEAVQRQGNWFWNDESISPRYRPNTAYLFHFRVWEEIFAKSIEVDDVALHHKCFAVFVSNGTLYFKSCSSIVQ